MIAAVLAAALIGSSCAYLSRSSSTPAGAEADAGVDQAPPRVSGTGRYVAFTSPASNLVTGDTNGDNDVFLRDHVNKTTTRVSLTATGGQITVGNPSNRGQTHLYGMSDDARYVLFRSSGDNVVPGVSGAHLYLRDRTAATTVQVDQPPAGGSVTAFTGGASSMSADGRYVAFAASGTTGAAGFLGIYVRDVTNGTTTVISGTTFAADTGWSTLGPFISPDGSRVAYGLCQLVATEGGPVASEQILLADRASATPMASVESFPVGSTASIGAWDPSTIGGSPLNADGTLLVYPTVDRATAVRHVRVYDDVASTRTTIFTSATGLDPVIDPSISRSGQDVLFNSPDALLPAGAAAGDLYAYDRFNGGRIRALHLTATGAPAANGSTGGAAGLSGDGRYVAFVSAATNFTNPPDSTTRADVFLRFAIQPTITAVAPSALPRGTADQVVTFTGTDLDRDGLTLSLDLGAGVTVTNVVAVNDTTVTAHVAVGPEATVGARTLTYQYLGSLGALTGAGQPVNGLFTVVPPGAPSSCGQLVSKIACENSRPGSPRSEWDVPNTGWTFGDSSIVGYTTSFSVDHGETVSFKVSTEAPAYTIDVYRMGWYQGNGARKVATLTPDASLAQNQPACLQDASMQDGGTGLVDCGNWRVSASWASPPDAVSGVYLAVLRRTDTGGASHVYFVVRDDESKSQILFQTNDTTWQAYNWYGGTSLYFFAQKVSYNRPFAFSTFLVDQFPMVRFLERNGYDVSYFGGTDSDQRGADIRDHAVFMSDGHDEYWSKDQRANVEAARDAGTNLAFFSGNEVFWKTRWEPSIDASADPHRTLVCYKETKYGAKVDPSPEWTGTWRDPRFSPPSDGGRPENALTGTLSRVNGHRADAITVPAADGKMRFWRNTSIASLPPSGSATLPSATLGYEWDDSPDNGFRPPGLFFLSTTTIAITDGKYLLDYGTTYGNGVATHHLTTYRAPSGALVFGAGTVQWAWGLDDVMDPPGTAPDVDMQQATVNVLADMGSQPTTLMAGLVTATKSTDTVAPTTTIVAPANNASVSVGSPVAISGTASDTGGGVVGGVEVSTDDGTTWHPATGRGTWTYTWTPGTAGPVTILARSVDDSANLQPVPASVTVSAS